MIADARGIAASLTRIGFCGVAPNGQDYAASFKTPGVTALTDLEYNALRRALAAFGRAAEEADQAILYYAGHGIEAGNLNYLIPVDAKLAHAKDVNFETASLMQVLGAVDGAHGLRLVILDACRDNPFRARLFPGREVTRGLRAIEPTGNILVAYAAKHGTVALDGKGSNSPYATALFAHMEEPGLEIVDLFREVKDAVLEATHGQQEPYLYGSLGRGREYLVPPLPKPEPVKETPAPEPAPFDERELELQWWERVKQSEDEALIAEFLQRLPEGVFAPLARDRLGELEWKRLKVSRDMAVIEAFLERWQGTRFEAPARVRLKASQGTSGRFPWKAAAGAGALAVVVIAGYLLWPSPTIPDPDGERVAVMVRAANGRDEKQQSEPGKSKSFQDCVDSGCATKGPAMVVVPAGSFMMGSPEDEKERESWQKGTESPQVKVTFKQPFAVGKYAVTRDEFQPILAFSGVRAKRHTSRGLCQLAGCHRLRRMAEQKDREDLPAVERG